MDLRSWNRFFWEIVAARLYKPGARLYLAFDESLLESELKSAALLVPEQGPTDSLNATIRLHCRELKNGFLGLSRNPNGICSKDNWDWVFQTDEDGVSLALTFAVQQILAAERMQGVSFYTAYWEMLGATADETRVNPFGDGGKRSFEELWGQLRTELSSVLGVPNRELTFRFGRGSNKYRNLPISQSLLSQGDLRLAIAAIPAARNLNDERLYAALRNVRLSSSGHRKIFMAPLRESLVRQVREFLESLDCSHPSESPTARRRTSKLDITALVLYEDSEFFGDAIFHCVSIDGTITALETLREFFNTRRCLIFQEQNGQITGMHGSVLRNPGTQLFILAPYAQADRILNSVSDESRGRPFSEEFASVETSLPKSLVLLRCLSLPRDFEGIDVSVDVPKRVALSPSKLAEIELVGGLCVNKASSSYVLGFGPDSILSGGWEVGGGATCEFDGETMLVADALERLSLEKLPCKYMLRVVGMTVFVNMVEEQKPKLRPSYFLTRTCMLPIVLKGRDGDDAIEFLEHACQVNTNTWTLSRTKRFRVLEAEITQRNMRWTRADPPSQQKCIGALGHLELPDAYRNVITRTIRLTNLVPLPLLRGLEV